MNQDLTQGISDTAIVILVDSDNNPVIGLTFSDVTANYKKSGQLSFTSKSLTNLNFIEVGNGFYHIVFTSSELSTAGDFSVIVNGASIRQFAEVYNVKSASEVSTAPTILTCTITGNIVDVSGSPVQGAAVTARVLGIPSIQDNGSGAYAFTDSYISVKTDVNGQFFLTLPQLLQVQVSIANINYTRSLTVPSTSTANLFSDIP